jgi:SAM-dependent methyltransferase
MNRESIRAREAVNRNLRAYHRIVDAWDALDGSDRDLDFRLRCRRLFMERLPGPKVLDAGCGLGFDALAFAASGLKVIAADFVVGFFQKTGEKRAREGVSFVGMDLTRPCFAPTSFDGIYAFASFLHVPRPLSALTLASFASLLVPGGVLFLHHVYSRCGLAEYGIAGLCGGGADAVAFCHSERGLSRLLRAAGFKSISIHHLATTRRPSALAERLGLEPYQVIARKGRIG